MIIKKLGKTFFWFSLLSALTLSCGKSDDDDDDSTTTDGGSSSTSSTAVKISGSLALSSSSSSSSLRLAATDLSTYTLRCVTLEGDLKACKDQLDSEGAFSMDCEGFKNVSWGGFLLDANGDVAGTLTSKQLLNAGNAELGLVFDPTTGLLTIKTLVGKDDSGTEVAASDEISLDPAVRDLTVKTGNYGFCMIDMAGEDIQKAHKGNVELGDVKFNECSGRTEQLYVKYNAFDAAAKALPSMEIWDSETDRNNCYVDNVLTYSVSDGTRSYSFTDDDVTFAAAFDAIYNGGTNSWAPAAAVQSYQISLAENAGEKGDNEQIKTELEGLFGAGNACSGLIDKLIEAYNKTTVITEKGFKRCQAIALDSGNADFDAEMAKDGPPPEWCVDYLEAPTDEEKTARKNRFVAECKAHVEGSGGESLWQKQGLVQEFFHILSEARHEGGDGRNSELRDAFNLAESKGITMTAEALASLSETCDATAEADIALAALAMAWSDLDHNWERQRFLAAAVDSSGKLNCSTISIDNFGNALTYTNGRALIKTMLTKKFNQHDQRTGLDDLKQQVCEGSHEMDLSGIDTTASYFTDFWANIDVSEHEPKFKSTVTDKKTPFLTFVNHLLDNNIVRGCSKSHMTNVKSALSDTSAVGGGGGGPGGPDEFIRWIGWQILDQKRRAALDSINTSPTSGTDPLTALDTTKTDDARKAAAATELPAFATKVANLAIGDPMRFGWLLMDLCHFIDLSTLTLDNSDVRCGAELPAALSSVCGGHGPGGGGGGSCTLPTLENRTEDKHLILSDLARRITEMKGRDAFRTDKDFKEVMRKIKANSNCLPDATLSRNPTLDADNNLVFEIEVRAPIAMMMNGEVNKQPQFGDTAATTDQFIIESARIEEEEGGMGSQGCYWGEIKRFKGVEFDTANDTFKGTFTEAFVDTCRNANSDDSGEDGGEESEHAWHRKFVATYEPTGSKTE